MKPILIVEDEPKIAELLEKYLQNSGFETHWIDDGLAASEWLADNQPAMILLDLMLHGKDGLELCKEVRQTSSTPIIMLTARVEEIDRLLGLELGADDYICKPFSPREVTARVKAVLRRTQQQVENNQIVAKEAEADSQQLSLNRDNLSIGLKGQTINLTKVEFELLEILHSHPGRIYSRQQLMEYVYPDNRIVSDRTIDSHIKKLRKKINELKPEQELIYSVYSVGYKFEL